MMIASLFRNAGRTAIFAGCCAAALTACRKEISAGKDSSGGGTIAVTFTVPPAPGAGEKTRAVIDSTLFRPGTYSVAFWICDHEETPQDFAPHMLNYGNLKAVMNVSGSTEDSFATDWKYGPDETRYLGVREKSDVDIYAYYPYVEGVADPRHIPFISGEDDWMWAGPARLTPEQTRPGISEPVNVPLSFSHVMACIEFRMKTKYIGNVEFTSVTLSNDRPSGEKIFCSAGTFDARNGTIVCDPGVQNTTLVFHPDPGNRLFGSSGKTFHLMLPEAVVNDYKEGDFVFSFVFNGIDAKTTYRLPAVMKNKEGVMIPFSGFKTGTKYIYELELDNTMQFEAIAVGQTTDWTNVEIDLEL